MFFSLIFFHDTFADTSCQGKNQLSEYGFALVEHVYKTFTVDRLVACFIACNKEPSCQSLNFNLADHTCEFNDTKHYQPKYFVDKPTFVYVENPDSGRWF